MIARFKSKKAFILPFVLIFVLSLSIIVVNFIENFNNKIKAPVYNTITTKNLIYKNVETILKSKLQKYTSVDAISDILDVPILLTDKKNTLNLNLILSKKNALIDINKINLDKSFWGDQFDSRYETSEGEYFFGLIKDVIKKKSILADDNYRFVEGKIYNLAHLQQIIDYYYEQTGDENIKKIPFSKIFCFDTATCEEVFYCKSAKGNEALERLIVNNIEMDYDEEDGFIIDCNNLDTFKNALNDKYKKTFNTEDTINEKLIGHLNYIVNDVQYKVNFVYNLKKSKIEEFDVKEN
jgi:hypothetical protein